MGEQIKTHSEQSWYHSVFVYLQMRLDEKSRENVGLNRQLESLLIDARRISDNARDKAASKVPPLTLTLDQGRKISTISQISTIVDIR